MEQEKLNWVLSSFELWRFYLLIFGIVLIAPACGFSEIRRRNKIILAVIGVALLLSLPLARRLIVKNHVEKDGYAFIVQDGWCGVNENYHEADPDDYLWKIFRSRSAFYYDHERKMIFFDNGIFDIYPEYLEQIRFGEQEN